VREREAGWDRGNGEQGMGSGERGAGKKSDGTGDAAGDAAGSAAPLEYVPYYEVQKETFTNYPFFRRVGSSD